MGLNKSWATDWMKSRSTDMQSGRMRQSRQEYVERTRQELKTVHKAQQMQKLKLNMAQKARVINTLKKYQPADLIKRSQDAGLSHKAANYGSQKVFQDQFRKAQDAARGLEYLSKKPQGSKAATKAAVLAKTKLQAQARFTLSDPKARSPFLKSDVAKKILPQPLVTKDTGKKSKKTFKLAGKLKAGDILNLFRTEKSVPDAKQRPQAEAEQADIAAKTLPVIKDSGKSDKKSDTKKKKIFETEEGKAKSKARSFARIRDGQGIETGVDLAGGGTDADNSGVASSDAVKKTDITREPLTETNPGRTTYCDVTPAQDQVLAYFSIWKTKVLKKRLAEIAEFNDELTQGLTTLALSDRVQGELGNEVKRFMYAPVTSEGYTRA